MPGNSSPWDRPGPWSARPARKRRSLAGVIGALLFSLVLWGCLFIGVAGLVLKINS